MMIRAASGILFWENFVINLLATCKKKYNKKGSEIWSKNKNGQNKKKKKKGGREEMKKKIYVPFPFSQSLFKKEMNTMNNATAAMSPIIIASVFSTSSSLVLVSPSPSSI